MVSLSTGRVHFQIKGCLVYVFIFVLFVIKIPLYANSVNPDPTPSDLGLHCLPVVSQKLGGRQER